MGRIVPLAKINAVSKSDLDATQAQYNAAKANVKAVESSVRIANINLSYCWIKSPISGLIGKTQAKVGEFVGQDPNPVILNTVSTIDTVHVEFYLVEADYLGLARKFIESSRQKEDADYIEREATRDSELTLILSDGSIFNHKGHVNFIDRQVNPETGSLLIQTSFPNPDQLLRPGQYAKVRAKMDVLKDGDFYGIDSTDQFTKEEDRLEHWDNDTFVLWLCPALLKYFDDEPEEIYVKVEELA